jgi:microcystin-dependent protein
MPLESASYINQLESANPASTDQLAQADDHLRLIKAVLKATFPNITGPVTKTQDDLNQPFVMPAGTIVSWYGTEATIPTGWGKCDGSTYSRSSGTGFITSPDLRDRTVIGAGTIATQGQPVGQQNAVDVTGPAGDHVHTVDGGSHSHTGGVQGHALTVAELPAHSHFEFVSNSGAYNTLKDNADQTPNTGATGSSSGSSYDMGSSTGRANVGKSSDTGSGSAHTHGIALDPTEHSHRVSTGGAHQHAYGYSTIQPSLGLHWIMKL